MSDGAFAAFAGQVLTGSAQATAALPTAELIARFENRLQTAADSEVVRYDVPDPAVTMTQQSDFRPLLEYAVAVSEDIGARLTKGAEFSTNTTFDPGEWPELKVLTELQRGTREMMLLQVQFQFISEGFKMAHSSVNKLYQPQG